MAVIQSVYIDKHTTASNPHPHILYVLQVIEDTGDRYEILRRYSEASGIPVTICASYLLAWTCLQFVALHHHLQDPFILPSKHAITTGVVPLAWVDDDLIAERKAGLNVYLTNIIKAPEFQLHPIVHEFMSRAPNALCRSETSVPCMISRDKATASRNELEPDSRRPIAAAYYPTWSAGSTPPDKIDFSRFDILFFGMSPGHPSANENLHDLQHL